MKAMVLAAGLGERLRPHTERVPKPLFPVLGVPIVIWVLKALRAVHVTDVVVNLHHLPAQIVRTLGNGADLGVHISYSDEPILLGTGGGLWAVRAFFQGEDAFFVHNADVWHAFDLTGVLEIHRREGANATLALVEDPSQPEAHVVEVSKGRVHGIRGRPKAGDGGRAVFSGVSVHTPVLFEHLPEGEVSCLIENGVIPMLAAGLKIVAAPMTGRFCDIGSTQRYLGLQWDLLDAGPRPFFEHRGLDAPRCVEAGVWFSGEPIWRPGVTFLPPVLVCDEARIGEGCVVGPRAVVCPHAEIEGGSDVRDAIVFPGVRTGGTVRGVVSQ